jgi:hypothetical protein
MAALRMSGTCPAAPGANQQRPLAPAPAPPPAGTLLQGPAGSSVVLLVKGGGPGASGAQREVTLEREPINIRPVDSALCSGGGE